jgi:hypothetical protein
VPSENLTTETAPADTRTWWRGLFTPRTVVGSLLVATALSLTPALPPAPAVESGGVLETASGDAQATTVHGASIAAGNPKAYAFLSQATPTQPIARWNPCAVINYRVNGSAGALADAKEAVRRIASQTGLRFSYRGPTTVIPSARRASYPADTQLIVAWAKPGQSTYMPARKPDQGGPAGEGGASWIGAHDARGRSWGKIVQGYVVLDATLELTGGFGAGPVTGWQGTRGQLLMHEIGHAIGLAHPKVADKVQIMYPTLSRKYAVWGAGDVAGLKILGKNSGCLS